MKIQLILLAFIAFVEKGYCQLGKSTRQIDSIVNNIKAMRSLVSKTIEDTTHLTYPNGIPIMGHYFSLKCQFEKAKSTQLLRVIKEKTVYYYNVNELIKVQDNTDRP